MNIQTKDFPLLKILIYLIMHEYYIITSYSSAKKAQGIISKSINEKKWFQ